MLIYGGGEIGVFLFDWDFLAVMRGHYRNKLGVVWQ